MVSIIKIIFFAVSLKSEGRGGSSREEGKTRLKTNTSRYEEGELTSVASGRTHVFARSGKHNLLRGMSTKNIGDYLFALVKFQ